MRLLVAILFLTAACGGGDQTGEPVPLAPAVDGGVAAGDAPTETPPDTIDAAPTPTNPGDLDAAPPSPPPPKPPRADAAPPPPPPDAAPPPDPDPVWSDTEKCENMCQSYCVHKHMCDGSDIDACRMAIDDADGGTCTERAHLFSDISQEQVEACIEAIEAMTCTEFLDMYNTGEGVPGACVGILS